MLAPRTTADLVDLAYEAALDTGLWPAVLEGVADAMGGEAATLTYQNQITGKGTAIIARLDPATIPLFFGHFATRNPLQKSNDLERIRRLGVGVSTDEMNVPKTELMKSEYYSDFLAPFRMHSLLAFGLALHGMNGAAISVARPRSKDPFDTSEIAFAKSFHRHLVRAFELACRLGQAKQSNESISGLLDRSPHGIFLLDDAGRFLYANSSGEGILSSRDGLNLDEGGFVAATAELSQKLAALIRSAASRDEGGGGSLMLPRRSGRRPYSVIVAPMRSQEASIFCRGPSAVVCVTDPDAGTVLPHARLKDLYGLTAAETKVAAKIQEGHDAKTVAQSMGMSINTARVHIAHIFEKTNTNRQPELVRLLMQLADSYVD